MSELFRVRELGGWAVWEACGERESPNQPGERRRNRSSAAGGTIVKCRGRRGAGETNGKSLVLSEADSAGINPRRRDRSGKPEAGSAGRPRGLGPALPPSAAGPLSALLQGGSCLASLCLSPPTHPRLFALLQERRRLQERILATRRELEEERLRVQRLKVPPTKGIQEWMDHREVEMAVRGSEAKRWAGRAALKGVSGKDTCKLQPILPPPN